MTMNGITSILLSGLQAAARRFAVSADNVVNIRTSRPVVTEGETPEGVFKPRRVVQIPLEGGGVQAKLQSVEPSTLTFADPDSPTGLAAFPNVSLEREIVDQRVAVSTYKAALAALRAKDEMDDALLDLES